MARSVNAEAAARKYRESSYPVEVNHSVGTGLPSRCRLRRPARNGTCVRLRVADLGPVSAAIGRRTPWPENSSFFAWLRSRGWSNLGHVGAAAFLGFLASLGGNVMFGVLWGAGLLLAGTTAQYWSCRRANARATVETSH